MTRQADAPQEQSVPALPDWADQAILVYGPRKGGTTLLLNLLDGSDALFAYPAELKTKAFVRMDWSTAALSQYRSQVRTSELERAGVPLEAYDALWKRIPTGPVDGDLATLVRIDASNIHQSVSPPRPVPAMWCAKDVGGRTHDIVALWRKLFPAARFIFIVRDPKMVTRAVLMDRRRKDIQLSVRQIIRETYDPMRVVTAQSSYLADDTTCFVAYEDLVADPPRWMRYLAVFAGVAYSKSFETPSSLGKPVVVRTSSKPVKTVFTSDAQWHDGLTLREKLIVGLTHGLMQFIPGFNVSYRQLRENLNKV